jgi:TRAP-type mannitol/chloroaromatic compound transport system substrate-binding protein
VQSGTVECCQTASYYYWGKDPTFTFATALPFGLNPRMHFAWWNHAGGEQLLNEFYAKYQMYGIAFGNTGAQMGGFYRKEINDVNDVKGLKMRIGGFAGTVVAKIGMVPQQLAAGDIYPALEKGTIDAVEWVGPYDDEKLGFHKVAKYYYFPGWWEGSASGTLFINKKKWDELPKIYKAVLQAATVEAGHWQWSKYDAVNPPALMRLLSAGVQVRRFPDDVMDASFKAANEIYADLSATNADFKKVYESIKAFRAESYTWYQMADYTYDTFMIIQNRKKLL